MLFSTQMLKGSAAEKMRASIFKELETVHLLYHWIDDSSDCACGGFAFARVELYGLALPSCVAHYSIFPSFAGTARGSKTVPRPKTAPTVVGWCCARHMRAHCARQLCDVSRRLSMMVPCLAHVCVCAVSLLRNVLRGFSVRFDPHRGSKASLAASSLCLLLATIFLCRP